MRVAAKRETNVLVHLAEREAADRRRQEEVVRLTASLLERMKEEKLAGTQQEEKEDEETTPDKKKPRGNVLSIDQTGEDHEEEERNFAHHGIKYHTARELSMLVTNVLTERAAVAQGAAAPPVEFFERIKIEEERVLRNHLVAKRPGGIAALYNSITLDRELHPPAFGGDPRQLPPPSVAVQQQPLAAEVIPAKVTELVAAGCGSKELERVKERRAEEAARLQSKLRELKRKDEEEREQQRRRAAQLDHERQTMLSELVAQDRSRQEARRLEKQALDEMMSSRAAVASFVNVSGPPSGDVLRSLLLAQRKPMHPVDVYQQTVRQEMGLPAKF